ncbi:MAG: pseudouridine synthase [Candidatus Hydrogenedentota bacterium]|nr:MAG: pseudouridine synthase [Candidatus Hydrogenedentota bacterium]
MRLQKYLAACSIASRRGSEKLIADGRVTVNGDPAHVGMVINPDSDKIQVDGASIDLDRKVYVVLNKPKDTITSAKDTHNRKTVMDCITDVGVRIYPVGRLDRDVTGALLLTNDGELTNRLIHPRYEIDKVYHAWVKGNVTPETISNLKSGITLEDGPTAPAKASILQSRRGATLIRLVIHEGRKRLVKRMCASQGHPVLELRRISIGDIRANDLQPGEWRHLTSEEIHSLKKLAHISIAN